MHSFLSEYHFDHPIHYFLLVFVAITYFYLFFFHFDNRFLIALLRRIKFRSKSKNPTYQYKPVYKFMTNREYQFLLALQKVCSDEVFIFPKVRLVDLILPDVDKDSDPDLWVQLFTTLALERVDFVMVDRSMNIIQLVLLDVNEIGVTDILDRKRLLDLFAESAGLAFVTYPARLKYDLDDLKQSILIDSGKTRFLRDKQL
ncbi:DUF2726 domain-containing protein [Thiomicrorhabdus sp.]|uniref:DUF2726 domain-containing protein n=1 Tax=Thiomicrorhabdus sp. TaxID=2039724 RepID=UPI0029C90036|nr:DUF2726 domain-containing protein [Thiomicrorhabdus sp.]